MIIERICFMKRTSLARRVIALCLCIVLTVGTLMTTACSDKTVTLASLDGNEISVNLYQFLLSRVKGTMARSGYTVSSDSFWDTVLDSDGTTWDTYLRQATLQDVRRYLAALVLFEEEGLVLPGAMVDKIDQEIEDYVTEAGSKSALNTQLGQYGINMDMLRDLYIIEAKFSYLQDHLYGQDGSLISAQVRQDYLNKNAVCFRQLLVRSYDYVYEKDGNGDEIYYLKDQNNAKVDNIAYDKKNGNVRLDAYGEIIADKNGESVYYTESGRIAYDKENGVRAIAYDANGNEQTVKCSAETWKARMAAAQELKAAVSTGDYDTFEALLEEYEASGDDAFIADGEYCFLYTTGDNSNEYLDYIADSLSDMKDGEVAVLDDYKEQYGCNVVMKYPMPDDAATNAAYNDWFSTLVDRVMAQLFHNKCLPHMDRVVVDNDAFASLPSMKEIGTNYNY